MGHIILSESVSEQQLIDVWLRSTSQQIVVCNASPAADLLTNYGRPVFSWHRAYLH